MMQFGCLTRWAQVANLSVGKFVTILLPEGASAHLSRGLVQILTGDGKGKTTSALGTAVRALGYGWKVAMIQFIKGTWKCGELNTIKEFGDRSSCLISNYIIIICL